MDSINQLSKRLDRIDSSTKPRTFLKLFWAENGITTLREVRDQITGKTYTPEQFAALRPGENDMIIEFTETPECSI